LVKNIHSGRQDFWFFKNPGLLLDKVRAGLERLPEPKEILAALFLPEKEKALAKELLALDLTSEEKKVIFQDFFFGSSLF